MILPKKILLKINMIDFTCKEINEAFAKAREQTKIGLCLGVSLNTPPAVAENFNDLEIPIGLSRQESRAYVRANTTYSKK